MSNWQQNFNLDAPEFVPKFNIPNSGQTRPQMGMPQMPPQMAPLSYFQQGPPVQQYRQPHLPQNQFANMPPQNSPQQIDQQVSNPQDPPSAPRPTSNESRVEDLSTDLKEKLSTKPVEQETCEQKQEASLEIEKSAPPSVSTIKEDEEWDKEGDDEQNADSTEGATEATKPSKKQLVVREYKAKKEPINVIFCGHVDAGKSTIGGQIMFLTGMVDKRTLEKYEREAKEKNRESWYLSWALDTNQEERDKGKTVEVGRAFFETEKKHFIILDAPGHKGFVPNMIGGASQADIAVLVISARKGEFETGFERGGQTREHAMLVKTAGVKYLTVLVNKMDDATVNWDQGRYEEIKEKLSPYLKKCGFQPGKDTVFMPCSGYTGAFIKEPASESICPWYRGPCFIEYLDSLPTINRTVNGPLRMPLIDKYKDMGTVVMGKIESGMIKLNDKLMVMPNKVKVEVVNIYYEEEETDSAICGDNVKLKLKGIEEEEISPGFVLCDLKDFCQVSKIFDAQVVILDYPSIITSGFNSIMHIHAATCEVQIKLIIGLVDKKTGDKDLKNRPKFIKQDQIAICRFEVLGNNTAVCMEPFKLFPQLGRFTLRYESKTVAVGKVLKIVE
ncbi:eukaryotic peptide chain release factor GTP-binding subunit ERF3A [Brachionus plicatilis]|uniref:Eukaryotic peptide chain release factor GTP-binding subunit ERF3A n=1 Tax=Brachionus plicatilis TaxID=10195 RepID=A0A3M7PVA6_BRAPC|nr:eukaryotic peptide chain release factor GTP-binding subunit ERF3A [Brachionus plicatilis]